MTVLPAHLQERLAPGAGTPREGKYVVCWLRMAARAHENAALDAALVAAAQLKLPVFVYQSLSDHYPYACDRFHTFALEGARDFEQQCAERNIAYAFHLQRTPDKTLLALCANAALVVCDDVPLQPFTWWDATVAAAAPLWRVDAMCVAPFRSVSKKPERAFEFRKEREAKWAQALAMEWPVVEPHAHFTLPELPFTPVTLAGADLGEWVASCNIDHSIGPAHQLPGGARAANARWRTFHDTKLDAYSRDRNDPTREGNSRLSPYLHFGHLSALTVAREAKARRTESADKFLDELLTWRELGWSFCAFEPQPHAFAALPKWAQQTLQRHAHDARPALFSFEQLARAQTSDPLWDAAQRQLLGRGELHNNVRMTWAKKLLEWTRSPAEALACAVDLNHRFALDGRDPASFTGLLWAFGAFDREFFPEQPIFGSVRTRPTEEAGKRFDVSAYSTLARRPPSGQPLTVAIVGAGVSGAACARALLDAGHEVRLFDKGSRAGGRCSTREVEALAPHLPLGGSPALFDFGAPFFRARDERFLRWVAGWNHEGLVARWENEGATAPGGLGKLVARMLFDCDVRFDTKVHRAERASERWKLSDEQGHVIGEYDALVVSTPAPQAAELLAWSASSLATRLQAVKYAPCWALLLSLSEPLDLPDVQRFESGPLSLLVRESKKPGRSTTPERWVVHASAATSRAHLEDDAAAAAAMLLDMFWAVTGARPQTPLFARAHRWRYARVETPLGVDCLYDKELALAVCGDGCRGDGLESAWLSGQAAAGRLNARRSEAALDSAPAPRPAPRAQLKLL